MSDDKERKPDPEEEEEERDYSKTSKLQKQLTVRKRGKTPKPGKKAAKEAEDEEEVKSAVEKKLSGKPARKETSALYKEWRKWTPTYLHQRPPSKMVFDAAFFAVSLVFVVKLGKAANDMLADYVPTEASMREQMA